MIHVTSDRPVEDILSRVVHVTLAGQVYDLTVLTIAGNKRWKASLDATLIGLLDRVEASDDAMSMLAVLARQVDDLLDLLYAYDTDLGNRDGVLPAREQIEETVYEDELLTAVREVWRAANPFVVAGLQAALEALQQTDSPAPSSSPQPSTGGRRRKSRMD